MSVNHLAVRRPNLLPTHSDAPALFSDMEDRRYAVPTLASLAHLDYRRHSTPDDQDGAKARRRHDSIDGLPSYYEKFFGSRRLSMLPDVASVLPHAVTRLRGSQAPTPTAAQPEPFGPRPVSAGPTPLSYNIVPKYDVEAPLLGLQAFVGKTWRQMRLSGRDAVWMSALFGLVLWNTWLTRREASLGRGPVYHDQQLERALIALDQAMPWRTEL